MTSDPHTELFADGVDHELPAGLRSCSAIGSKLISGNACSLNPTLLYYWSMLLQTIFVPA